MPAPSEIRALTGIRGIAALSVALVHLQFTHIPIVQFLEFHDQAVDLFFCLSGFTLALVYQAGSATSLPFRRYAIARIARIYPLYAAILIFCWLYTLRHLAGSPLYPEHLALADAIRNALLINSWPFIGSGSNWDSPAWSLSVEAFCYIALFPTLFVLSPLAERRSPALRLAIITLLTFTSFIAFSRYWDVQILIARAYNAATISYFIPLTRGITLFTAGWLIQTFHRQNHVFAQAAGAAADVIALAALVILTCASLNLLPKALLILIAPPLILGLAANPAAITARLLATPPIHFLGEISYAIYLLHEPLQNLLTGKFPKLYTTPHIAAPTTFIALIALSAISYYGFEKPMRAFIKRGLPQPKITRPANP